MSEAPDQESKTEEATEKKVRDSVEKGKIPVSREASVFSSMIALLIVLSFLTVDSVRNLSTMRSAIMDENTDASRETGILPFSTESRTFFSVASSVLLSWSGASDITARY